MRRSTARAADLRLCFRICKNMFSHNAAHSIIKKGKSEVGILVIKFRYFLYIFINSYLCEYPHHYRLDIHHMCYANTLLRFCYAAAHIPVNITRLMVQMTDHMLHQLTQWLTQCYFSYSNVSCIRSPGFCISNLQIM